MKPASIFVTIFLGSCRNNIDMSLCSMTLTIDSVSNPLFIFHVAIGFHRDYNASAEELLWHRFLVDLLLDHDL